jgi:general stress protein CsbA
MHKKYFVFLILLSSCIGTDVLDDFVDSEIVITIPVISIEAGTMYAFEAVYRNNVGREEDVELTWQSSDTDIVEVDQQGVATAVAAGMADITVRGGSATLVFVVEIGESTVESPSIRSATLETVSSYPMTGSATLEEIDGELVLKIANDFVTTSALPGLYIYLSNNPSSLADSYEISRVNEFEGAQEYRITDDIGLFDYEYVLFFCKPFVVPVGNGRLNP